MTISVGLITTTLHVIVALLIVVPMGLFGGKLDLTVQWIVDVWMAFPSLLIITFMALLSRGSIQLALILGISAPSTLIFIDTINDTIVTWPKLKRSSRKCKIIHQGFAIMISVKYVTIFLVKHVKSAVATVFTGRLGLVIQESISKIKKGWRKFIKFVKF